MPSVCVCLFAFSQIYFALLISLQFSAPGQLSPNVLHNQELLLGMHNRVFTMGSLIFSLILFLT